MLYEGHPPTEEGDDSGTPLYARPADELETRRLRERREFITDAQYERFCKLDALEQCKIRTLDDKAYAAWRSAALGDE